MNMYVCIEASGLDSQEMPHLTWEVIMEGLSRVYSEFNSLHCICLGYLYLVCSYLHIWNMNFMNIYNDIIYHGHNHYDFTTIMILPSLVYMYFIPGQFWPSGIFVACICVCICVCVCHVCQLWGCPSPVQARAATKFGQKMQSLYVSLCWILTQISLQVECMSF